MLFFVKAFAIKALGLFSFLIGVYAFWLCLTTLKSSEIRIDDHAITFPSFSVWGKYMGTRMPWADVLAVYTLGEYSSMETYVIPMLRTGDTDFDAEINGELKKGKAGKKAREYFDYLRGTSQMFRVSRSINNYPFLLKDICKRATRASIDEDTRRRKEGKEYLVHLSEGTRRVLNKIFWQEDVGSKTVGTKGEKKRKQKDKGHISIMFVNKPVNPYWLILISFVLSFLIGGFLACRNYALMGKHKKCGVVGMMIFAGLVVVTVTYLYAASDLINVLFLINFIAGVFIGNIQRPDYLEWKIRQSIRQKRKGDQPRRYEKKGVGKTDR